MAPESLICELPIQLAFVAGEALQPLIKEKEDASDLHMAQVFPQAAMNCWTQH